MRFLIGALLSVFAYTSIYAQILVYSNGSVEYKEQTVKTINIKLEPKPKTVRESFENWMDDNYDVDLDGKKLLFFNKEIMSAKGVVIPEISKNMIDLLVKVDESASNATTLHVFASFGYNNWITLEEHPFEYLALEEIVQDYIRDYLPEYYLGKVEDTRETLEELVENKEDINEKMNENDEEIAELKRENQELMRKWRENQRKIREANIKMSKRKKDFKSVNKIIKSNK